MPLFILCFFTLFGAGLFFLLAHKIHYSESEDDDLKPWRVLSIMIWGNVAGVVLCAVVALLAFINPFLTSASFLTVLFLWLGYLGATVITFLRSNS